MKLSIHETTTTKMSLIDISAYLTVLAALVGCLSVIYYFVNFEMAVIVALGLIIMGNAQP